MTFDFDNNSDCDTNSEYSSSDELEFDQIYLVWNNLKECFPYFTCDFKVFYKWMSGEKYKLIYTQEKRYINNYEEYFSTELKVTWNIIKNYNDCYDDWVLFCYNNNT
jgi:hypothetical protein